MGTKKSKKFLSKIFTLITFYLFVFAAYCLIYAYNFLNNSKQFLGIDGSLVKSHLRKKGVYIGLTVKRD